ncbi:dehydrogenase [Fictibacillus phosphorivorans]|uniref:Dehydrogenase n=1 Tax=Fictibacillus phosphorivorans TaxID=1221500 RepID=A0A165P508_9BACL|nr:FAD-dependent oxidoreductase [Fictibacillus phosphorivorans]KZE68985.1 dehydrogenase [Fictibacillus phosphorivorans]
MNKYDVAIIGGGIAGLTAAAYVAQAGISVVVVEKGNLLGGRAQTVHKNGVLFNLGGHALYRGGAGEKILKELKVNVAGGIPDTKGYALWNGELLNLPDSLASLFKTKLLTWSGKMELGKIMMKLRKLDTAKIPPISLRDWAENNLKDPMVRHVFYALCRTSTYCINPDQQLASAVIQQVQLGMKGVLYIDGGWESIVEKLRIKAVGAGAIILTNKKVASVGYENEHQLQFTDGEMMEVPTVLLTCGPDQSCNLIKNAEGTMLDKWKQQAQPIYASCLDVALKNLPNPNHHFAIGIDQHILFSNHSRASKLGEDGSKVLQLIKYLGTEKETKTEANKQELESIMDLMQPGWRKELIAQQFLPHMVVVQDCITIHDKQYFGPSVPEIPGLYIAGDGTGHGEMLVDAAFASAKRAAETIIQHNGFQTFSREA